MTSEKLSQIDTPRAETGDLARHIASTAARLFAQQGFDATSVREIVEAAGVAKPTLYYHFGSKEGLAQALLTVPLKSLAEKMAQISGATEDPVEALAQTLEAQFEFCRENPDRARFIYALMFGPLGAGLANELAHFKSGSNDCMSGVARRLADAGIVGVERLEAFLLACQGTLMASTLAYLYRDKQLEPGLSKRLVRDLLRGFAKRDWSESGSINED